MHVDRRTFLTAGAALGVFNLARHTVPGVSAIAYGGESSSTRELKITDVITDSTKINTDSWHAYYKVDVGDNASFYIVQRKDARIENAFTYYFDGDKNKVFGSASSTSQAVAVVPASKAGLQGEFEVYRNGDSLDISYDFHPLIVTQSHTEVDSKWLTEVDTDLKAMPQEIMGALNKRGFEFVMGKSIEDVHYHLYPGWKNYDTNNPNDPKKPWLEVKKDGTCIDHRNHSNSPGCYTQKRVLMPQTNYSYGARKLVDKMKYPTWRRHLTHHEIGHAVDYINGDDYPAGKNAGNYVGAKLRQVYSYSDSGTFQAAFNIDRERMDPAVKDELAYSVCKSDGRHRECFANLYSALIGGETKKSAALLLNTFPNAAEYLRKTVFPDFGVTMSVEDVRKNIYPDYLKDARLLSQANKVDAAVELASMFYESDPLSDNDIKDVVLGGVACCGK